MKNTTPPMANTVNDKVNEYTFMMCLLGYMRIFNGKNKKFDKAGLAYYVSTVFTESETTKEMFPNVLPDKNFSKMGSDNKKIDLDRKKEGAVLYLLNCFEESGYLKNNDGKISFLFDERKAWNLIEGVTGKIDRLRLDLEIKKIAQNFIINEKMFIEDIKEITIDNRLGYCLKRCHSKYRD